MKHLTQTVRGASSLHATRSHEGTPRSGAAGNLGVSALTHRYGAITAVDDVTLDVTPGSVHALIGPNGAGKSTLFSLMAGMMPPHSGRVFLDDIDVTRMDDRRRNRLGVAKTFQHSSLFDQATCRENVYLGAARADRLTTTWWRPAAATTATWSTVDALLDRVGLTGRRDAAARLLSHGERRQLEIAVALATAPRVLLLDEPTAGMSRAETEVFVDVVHDLTPELTVVLIEHDLDVVFELAETISVLASGRLIATGPAAEVRSSVAVQEAYLNEGAVGQLFHDGDDE